MIKEKVHPKTLWKVARILKTSRKRKVPVHVGMICARIDAPNEEIAVAMRALHTCGMADVNRYSTKIVTATTKPLGNMSDANRKVMRLLEKQSLSEPAIALNLKIMIWQARKNVSELEEGGWVTTHTKSFEYMMIHSPLSILKTMILRILGWGKPRNVIP